MRASERQSRLEDIKFSIDQTSGWIRHADSKAAILATALGVASGLVAGQVSDSIGTVHTGNGWSWVVAFALAGVAGTAIVTGVFLTAALLARVAPVSAPNRFSWPDIARNGLRPPAAGALDESWQVLKVLSEIAAAKYRNVNRASVWFIAFVFMSTVLVLATIVGKP